MLNVRNAAWLLMDESLMMSESYRTSKPVSSLSLGQEIETTYAFAQACSRRSKESSGRRQRNS